MRVNAQMSRDTAYRDAHQNSRDGYLRAIPHFPPNISSNKLNIVFNLIAPQFCGVLKSQNKKYNVLLIALIVSNISQNNIFIT